MPNPYLIEGPKKRNLVEWAELGVILHEIKRRRNFGCIVEGHVRMGKTVFLEHLKNKLDSEFCVLANLFGAHDLRAALIRMMEKMKDEGNKQLRLEEVKEIYERLPSEFVLEGALADPLESALVFLSSFISVLEKYGRTLILLLDNITWSGGEGLMADKHEDGTPKFSVFVHRACTELPVVLILTGYPGLRTMFGPVSPLLQHYVFLKPFDQKQTIEAIENPLKTSETDVIFDEPSKDFIFNLSAGHPEVIRAICRVAFDGCASGIKITKECLDKVLENCKSQLYEFQFLVTLFEGRDEEKILEALSALDKPVTPRQLAKSCNLGIKKFSNAIKNLWKPKHLGMYPIIQKRGGKIFFSVPLLSDFLRWV